VYVLIGYRNGLIREGVLMAIQGNEVRIAVKGEDDVMVFRLLRSGWTSESCEVVTFDFPMAPFCAIGMVPNAQNTIEEPPFQSEEAWEPSALVN
jgi:hypothetical protein